MARNYPAMWGPALARSILQDYLELKKGDKLVVEAWTKNLPWVDSFLIEARRLGALPLVVYESDAAYWESFENGWLESLGTFTPTDRAILENTDAYVYLYGPADRYRLLTLPPEKLKQIVNFEHDWFKLAAEKGLRWCRVELTRATPKLAREYGVSYQRWIKELFEASTLKPRELSDLGTPLAKKIEEGESILISHPNGTNLELRLKERRSFVWDGKADEVMVKTGHGSTIPSGAVLTSVDEQFGEGQIISNQITRYGTGRGIGTGIKWTLKGGRLEDYSLQQGKNEFLKDLKAIGEGNVKPAVLIIGLNQKIRKAPLFEIYERGTVSFALGANEEMGGETKGHERTWITLRGANVSVDGEKIIHKGKIV
jgi:leucyl aminopeptidase (aminopeptidase T)